MTDFSPFLDAYGSAIDSQRASAALLSKYREALPEVLLEFWKENGFGGFARGLIWIVDPSSLEDGLAEWVPSKKGKTAIPVARTAFGNIIYWQGAEFTFLDVHYDRSDTAGSDAEILFGFYLVDKRARKSILEEPLFKKALAAHGELTRDEMYAFGLPLATGGDEKVKNLVKVAMREQLAILRSIHRGDPFT